MRSARHILLVPKQARFNSSVSWNDPSALPRRSASVNSVNATSTLSDTTAAPSASASAYKRPTPPTGIQLSRLKMLRNAFPLTFKESYALWRGRKNVIDAEKLVLSHLPFYPECDGKRHARTCQVPVANGNFVNEFEITNVEGPPVKKHLVMLHGYGAGLAFYYKNFDAISSIPGWSVHALDLLGYGNSSRPKFNIKAKMGSDEARQEVVEWFSDAIENWRKEKGIKSFTLVAHSLGAYIGSFYAMLNPGIVDKMLLVSPAAVNYPRRRLNVPSWFEFLWERNVSPFAVVRNLGPFGAKLTSGWTARRFALLPKPEAEALNRYTYSIFAARGSGEYALNYLLEPGATGRFPLVDWATSIPCPTKWIYGDHDWMDVTGGIEACLRIRDAGKYHCDWNTIANAGHQIHLDNPAAFNSTVIDFMKSN